MFHKVQDVKAMPDFILKVDFINGICTVGMMSLI